MVMTIDAHVFGTIVLCMIIMYSRPERALVMDVAFVTTIGAITDNVNITKNMTVSISANMAAAEHTVLTCRERFNVSKSSNSHDQRDTLQSSTSRPCRSQTPRSTHRLTVTLITVLRCH